MVYIVGSRLDPVSETERKRQKERTKGRKGERRKEEKKERYKILCCKLRSQTAKWKS